MNKKTRLPSATKDLLAHFHSVQFLLAGKRLSLLLLGVSIFCLIFRLKMGVWESCSTVFALINSFLLLRYLNYLPVLLRTPISNYLPHRNRNNHKLKSWFYFANLLLWIIDRCYWGTSRCEIIQIDWLWNHFSLNDILLVTIKTL